MRYRKAYLFLFSIIMLICLTVLIYSNRYTLDEDAQIKENKTNVKFIDPQFSKINFKEIGPVPVSVLWEDREYIITDETISEVDSKIGLAIEEGTINHREVYSIINKDSRAIIAIPTLNNDIYLVAKAK